MTCLCVLTSIAWHKRRARIRRFNSTSQGWLSIQTCPMCGLSEVETPGEIRWSRTTHRPDSLIGRKFGPFDFRHLEIFVRRISSERRILGQQSATSAHPQCRSGDFPWTWPEASTSERESPSPDNNSTGGGEANRAFALRQSTMSQRRFSFFFTKKTLSTQAGRRVRAVSPIFIV